jgi:uncharacterized protein
MPRLVIDACSSCQTGRAAALGDDDRKALKRLECPYVIEDKRGKFVTNLCF